MADARKRLGDWGEGLAANYLQNAGYRIVAAKWRSPHGEIDLIARDGDTLVFVEVKTRRGRLFGAPEEAVTAHKQQKLTLLAQQYMLDHDLDSPWRIDVVAVELDSRGVLLRCDHLINAVTDW
jgi:putative endonuclease